jgi:putative chitinase
MSFQLPSNIPSSTVLPTFYSPSTTADMSGLSTVLGMIQADTATWDNVNQIAYALATIKWETSHTFNPIHEMGSISYFDQYDVGTPRGKGLGNTNPGDGFLFRGRGYVQITGRENYTHIGSLVGVDLVSNPDLALQPPIAYQIAANGMKNGWFAGRRLSQYIPTGAAPDYVNARRIINGLDHAADIAAIAQTFQGLLGG